MNTTEKNKLIAEFMGATYSQYFDGSKGVILTNYGVLYEGVKGLRYSIDWNWLIPVFVRVKEEVKSIKIDVDYTGYVGTNMAGMAILNGRIEEAFEHIVSVIEWYNKLKKIETYDSGREDESS